MNIKKLLLNERIILLLIILNAFVIFIQEFNYNSLILQYTDNLFILIFTAEILVKVQDKGWKKYWASKWNRLDFITVSLALLSFILELTDLPYLNSLEFITTFRVLRLFKSFRLIKFVPNISSILAGVNQAIKASYVVVLSFFILLFIVAILTCSLFREIAPEHFGTPLNSLYSVFRIFSIEGWYEIPDLIAERTSTFVSFLSKLYFCLLLFGGGILGMSLINSIFVDAMVSDNNDELEKEVKELNKKIDVLLKELKLKEKNTNP
ncbi:MAG: ion transporter [Tannerellaceae bacterium]|nr:ion transporter [Tannerellaceae bacterium]